jgi:hypothetical protein
MAHERKTGRVMAIKGFGQLNGIPHSEYYLLNILSEKVLTSHLIEKVIVYDERLMVEFKSELEIEVNL